jgi:hypothetical protein
VLFSCPNLPVLHLGGIFALQGKAITLGAMVESGLSGLDINRRTLEYQLAGSVPADETV